MFADLLKVVLPGTDGLEGIIATLVAIIGFVSIYLTFMFYDCKIIRVVFVILGTVGLVADCVWHQPARLYERRHAGRQHLQLQREGPAGAGHCALDRVWRN